MSELPELKEQLQLIVQKASRALYAAQQDIETAETIVEAVKTHLIEKKFL